VEFRGIRLGEVTEIAVDSDLDGADLRIPVLVELEPERLRPVTKPDLERDPAAQEAFMESLVARGLRARLQTANLITGQLYVELDMHPDAPAAELGDGARYPVLPTLPRPLSGITASVGGLLQRLERVPLEAIGANLEGATAAADSLLSDPRLAESVATLAEAAASLQRLAAALERDAPPALGDLRAASGELRALVAGAGDAVAGAEEAFAAVEGLAAGRTTTGARLQQALTELEAAARALRLLAEYLERRPDALLRGR
jgi:paraquat-inducible protein B